MARRFSKRYRRKRRSDGESSGYKRNPPLMTDVFEWIAPGFAGFAAARFGTRLAASAISKRKPSLGRHAGGAAAVLAFLAAWYLSGRWKAISKYQMPLVVGSGIAAIQSLLQLYIPKLGWTVAYSTPEITEPAQQPLPEGSEVLEDEDPNLYTYDDRYDSGRMGPAQHRADRRAAAAGSPATHAQAQVQAEEDLLQDLFSSDDDAVGQTVNMGVFTN